MNNPGGRGSCRAAQPILLHLAQRTRGDQVIYHNVADPLALLGAVQGDSLFPLAQGAVKNSVAGTRYGASATVTPTRTRGTASLPDHACTPNRNFFTAPST